MTLNKTTVIAYHKRVIELRLKEITYKEIFAIVETEYFILAQKHRYCSYSSFRNIHYRYKRILKSRI